MLTQRAIEVFTTFTHLQSFKVMIAYLLMIAFSSVYQNQTKPMSLRWVSIELVTLLIAKCKSGLNLVILDYFYFSGRDKLLFYINR